MAYSSSQRYVHAFPRIARHKQIPSEYRDEIGINILKSIFSDGLLLTPEEFKFPVDDVDSPYGGKIRTKLLQRRACFALLPVFQLYEDSKHRDIFGDFAIGIDTANARKLGILPTIYHYDRVRDDQGQNLSQKEGVSRELLCRLDEIRRLLIAIAWIEAAAFPGNSNYFTKEELLFHEYTLIDEPPIWSQLCVLSERRASEAYKLLDTYRVPATAMIGCFDLILSLFQTADSSFERRHLDYYSQREWRIVASATAGIDIVDLAHSRPGRRDFIKGAKENLRAAGVNVNIKECFLLEGANHQSFHSFISDIFVPRSAFYELKETLEEHSFENTNRGSQGIMHFCRRE